MLPTVWISPVTTSRVPLRLGAERKLNAELPSQEIVTEPDPADIDSAGTVANANANQQLTESVPKKALTIR